MILPPGGEIVPLCWISASSPALLVGTATWRKSSPETLSVADLPEPSPALPSGTTMRPLLLTVPPISAA